MSAAICLLRWHFSSALLGTLIAISTGRTGDEETKRNEGTAAERIPSCLEPESPRALKQRQETHETMRE